MLKKTIFLGDTHGTDNWKKVVTKEAPERVVFVGDYFDSFQIPTTKQVENFLDIVEYKVSGGAEVVMLIGNHDIHYMPGMGDSGTAGYQYAGKYLIEPVVEKHAHHLSMAYQMPGTRILCTHAGVGEEWLKSSLGREVNFSVDIADVVNSLWKSHPKVFNFNGTDMYGDDVCQTPIWIRPRALKLAGRRLRNDNGYLQIVGHTSPPSSEINPLGKEEGYFFIDCIDSFPWQYLVYENGNFSIGNI